MKKIVLLGLSLILFACAPALNRELLREGDRSASLDDVRANPDAYRGKLFILGGVIVDSRFVQNGSQLEVFSVPVDSNGYLKGNGHSRGRFLAIYPREKGLLDPVVFKKGRQVTLAGVFLDIRKSKIDDMEYTYPVFEIKQIRLWDEEPVYSMYPYYPYGYHYYYPYPYSPYYSPYWGPWPPPPGW